MIMINGSLDFHLHIIHESSASCRDAGGLVDQRLGAQVEAVVGQEARRPGSFGVPDVDRPLLNNV